MSGADPADQAAALLAGPWTAEAMAIRLTIRRGAILVPEDVELTVRAVLRRFPTPPDADELIAFLAAPPLLLDPRPDPTPLERLLGVDSGELAWFADRQGRSRRAQPVLQHYSWRVLPKRGGVRIVAAPKSRLKEIQRRLLRQMVGAVPLHDAAHGCVPGRSVRTALAPHAGSRVLIRLDLESFFATISAGRVRGILIACGAALGVADVVTGLCTTAVPVRVWHAVPRPVGPAAIDAHARLGALLRDPHLPQGAPTSPALANAVAYRLDRRLTGVARRFGARYTRYVDDLLFSGEAFTLSRRHRLLDAVEQIVADEGFRLNERKTAVQTSAGRLGGLGAVVNVRPTLPRPERDRLRAIVHNCVVRGGQSQARGRPAFRDELLGRIAAAAALDPAFGARLRARYDEIDWS